MKNTTVTENFDILGAFFEDVAQVPPLAGRNDILPLTRRIRRGLTLRKLISNNPEKTLQRIAGKFRECLTAFELQAKQRNRPSLDLASLSNEIEPFFDNPRQIVPPTLARSFGMHTTRPNKEIEKYEDLGWRCFYLFSLLPPHLRLQQHVTYSADVREYLRSIHREANSSKTRLVEGTIRYAIVIARLYVGTGIPFLDLVQEGIFGILRAADRYNEQRGAHFQAYATSWIRQRIERSIAEQARLIRVPVHQLEIIHKIDRYVEEYLGMWGDPPTDTQIFLKMGWIEAEDLPLIEQLVIEQRLKRLQAKLAEYQVLLQYIKNPESVVKPSDEQKLLELQNQHKELAAQLGREPQDMEIFRTLDWFTEFECDLLQRPPVLADSKSLSRVLSKLRKAQEQISRYKVAKAKHLDPYAVHIRLRDGCVTQVLANVLPDRKQAIAGVTNNHALSIDLEKLLEQLSDRERYVINQRFGLAEGDVRTLEEIAKELGVTRERIRQIEAKALRKLKQPVRNYALKEYLENTSEVTISITDQVETRIHRAFATDAQMQYNDNAETEAEVHHIEQLINKYVSRGRTRVIDTRRQISRVELFEKVLEDADSPLHYSVIHDRALEKIPEALHFNKQQSYATLFYRPEIFRPMGGAVFGLTTWSTNTSVNNGENVLQHCPKPLLRRDDPRSFLEAVLFGRDLLLRQPDITAEQFYAEQLAFALNHTSAGQDVQSAFDAWYAAGLLEHVRFEHRGRQFLKLTLPQGLHLHEVRMYCVNMLCRRVVRMPELLQVLDSIAHPTITPIQKALFGSEHAGFDVYNRLLLFQAFEAVRRDRDEWRLTQLGYTALSVNHPQDLPDFGEMTEENREGDVVTVNWEDELALLDV